MKLLIFTYMLLITGLSSCVDNSRTRELPISDYAKNFQEVAKQFPFNASGDVKVVTIDSCEYIVWAGSNGEIGYAHKGNCKWCKLRCPCQ